MQRRSTNATHAVRVIFLCNELPHCSRRDIDRDHLFNGRSFFTRADYRDIGRGVELWRGFFQYAESSFTTQTYLVLHIHATLQTRSTDNWKYGSQHRHRLGSVLQVWLIDQALHGVFRAKSRCRSRAFPQRTPSESTRKARSLEVYTQSTRSENACLWTTHLDNQGYQRERGGRI